MIRMTKKTAICFVGNLSYSFVKRDYETLSEKFHVNLIKPPKAKTAWLKYLIYLAKNTKKSLQTDTTDRCPCYRGFMTMTATSVSISISQAGLTVISQRKGFSLLFLH